MNDLPRHPAAEIVAVEDRFFTLRNFPLTDGTVMPEAAIAYEIYGRLAPDGRNAILCTHGYTASHHFAGRNPANGNQPGSWDGLIGPGKAIDTDKLFVVASNMLGSSFRSTNAGSINPQTGEAYGPDFPHITIRDIVAAQKALLDHLGIRHLVAVAGPSYGGYQAFQWAVAYPDFMDAIVPVNTAPWASVNTDKQLAELEARLAGDPEWHDGRYYGKAACKTVLTEIRVETLKRYGIETALAPRFPDPAAREAAIREQAANWAAKWDATSLIILRRALIGFDTRPDFARIKAKVLYILCRTDALFPPKIAPDVIKASTAARVEARYFEHDSDLGHSSSDPEHTNWSPVLREFLAPLVAPAELRRFAGALSPQPVERGQRGRAADRDRVAAQLEIICSSRGGQPRHVKNCIAGRCCRWRSWPVRLPAPRPGSPPGSSAIGEGRLAVQIVRAPQNALVAGCWRRAASCRRPRGSCPAVAACRLSGGSSASAVA